MSRIEVSARMKVRPGQLEGFKRQASECVRVTREQDTKTLRYDLFLSNDGTEAEFREAYTEPEGLLEHRAHVREPLNKLFAEFAEGHNVIVFGQPSAELVAYANAQMPPGSVKWYDFVDGLAAVPVAGGASST